MRPVVTVLGGYGIFGGRVARALAATEGLDVRVAGRDHGRGEAFAQEIGARFVPCILDGTASLAACLDGCDLLIHAAGPFQGQDYVVARACIDRGIPYLDLADARDFVCGVSSLGADARAHGVFVGSGASSVPTVTWALVAALAPEFARIESIHAALSPGNQNPRGASTIEAILGAIGSPIRVWRRGAWARAYGWGGRTQRTFPSPVGGRHVYDCDVPDLQLFGDLWGAQTVGFQAGLEFAPFNHVLSGFAALRRAHLAPPLTRLAPLALRVSLGFFACGSKNGALAVWVRGDDHSGRPLDRKIALVTDDDGPATPSAPAVLLARKLLLGGGLEPGARHCAGLLTLDDLRAYLEPLGIWCARSDASGTWVRLPSLGAASAAGGHAAMPLRNV